MVTTTAECSQHLPSERVVKFTVDDGVNAVIAHLDGFKDAVCDEGGFRRHCNGVEHITEVEDVCRSHTYKEHRDNNHKKLDCLSISFMSSPTLFALIREQITFFCLDKFVDNENVRC